VVASAVIEKVFSIVVLPKVEMTAVWSSTGRLVENDPPFSTLSDFTSICSSLPFTVAACRMLNVACCSSSASEIVTFPAKNPEGDSSPIEKFSV